MKQIFKSREKLWVSLIIIAFAVLLVTPQLFTRKVILGSDSIFHYNRFYEAAMQLKNGNLSYFLSLYGFQQSGRIVNALYGPFFAYLQGGLILISGTWFRYQIVSRILLHILAESSMYVLLKQCKVKTTIALYSMRQHSLSNTGRCVRVSLVGEQLYYLFVLFQQFTMSFIKK